MAGTKIGGQRAAAKNKAKYGEDFYAKIGKVGGENGHTGGFYANRHLASVAGAVGGAKSRRNKIREQSRGIMGEVSEGQIAES